MCMCTHVTYLIQRHPVRCRLRLRQRREHRHGLLLHRLRQLLRPQNHGLDLGQAAVRHVVVVRVIVRVVVGVAMGMVMGVAMVVVVRMVVGVAVVVVVVCDFVVWFPGVSKNTTHGVDY